MILIDTSSLIEMVKGSQKGALIMAHLGDDPFSIAAVTLHEFRVGSDAQLRLPVVPFTPEVAERSGLVERELRKQGKMINNFDILIASTCLVHDATLITCDKDFKKIPGLNVRVF